MEYFAAIFKNKLDPSYLLGDVLDMLGNKVINT